MQTLTCTVCQRPFLWMHKELPPEPICLRDQLEADPTPGCAHNLSWNTKVFDLSAEDYRDLDACIRLGHEGPPNRCCLSCCLTKYKKGDKWPIFHTLTFRAIVDDRGGIETFDEVRRCAMELAGDQYRYTPGFT